jgi:hypothetical membrane protein
VTVASFSIRRRLDSAGVLISGLCMIHCLAGLVFVTVLGVGGGVLLDPKIHEIGLALAVVVGGVGLGLGVLRHRRYHLLVPGIAGLLLMTAAMVVGHRFGRETLEAPLTMLGVGLLAWAHWRNMGHHRHPA